MKYNILWVCADQLRADKLGCNGDRFADTPNIDRMAENGVNFTNAYCQNPTCTPSRASFLTGRYPRTCGCRQNGQPLPMDEILVTKLLADNGYRCGLAGKLHIRPNHPAVAPNGEKRSDDGYSVFHSSGSGRRGWGSYEYRSWLKSKGVSFHVENYPDTVYVQYGMDLPHHHTTWCFEKARDFIEEAAANKTPWLFSVNTYDPHHPFDPPRELLDKYEKKMSEFPLPNYVEGELDNKNIFQKQDHESSYNSYAARPKLPYISHGADSAAIGYEELTGREHRLLRAAYYAMIELIDRQLGETLDLIDRLGQRENTIVIFMADHGEMLGDHGIYLKGPHFYEPAVNIPLIMSCPGLIRDHVTSKALVELIDIAPTLCEAGEVKHQVQMQGRSLWKLLTDREAEDRHRDSVYCEYYNSMPWHQTPKAYCTMRFDGRYKIVAVHSTDEYELYDLQKDPGETHNYWNDPEYAEIRLRLLQKLCDSMAYTADPMEERKVPW